MRLSGPVAVVTGAGTGIGRAIALKFAEEGADVAVHYSLSEREAKEVAEIVSSRKRGTVKADASNPREVREMKEKILEEFGRVDMLVNNADTLIRGPLEKT